LVALDLALCFEVCFALGWFDGGVLSGFGVGVGNTIGVKAGLLNGKCGWKSSGKAITSNEWNMYPSWSFRFWTADKRPVGLKARVHPACEYFAAGRIRDER